MKRYIFSSKAYVEAENLDAETIKKYESTMGKLLGVLTDNGYVEVVKDIITIPYKGETHTFKEWAEITGIQERTLRSRYAKGERDYILFRSVGT